MEHSNENVAQGAAVIAHGAETETHDKNMVHGAEKITHNEQEWQKLADFFKIMGDKTRVSILSVLLQKEMCVKDIYQELGLNTSMVSHQLKILRAAKIVKARRDGKNVFYSLDDEHVEQVISVALEHIRHDEAE